MRGQETGERRRRWQMGLEFEPGNRGKSGKSGERPLEQVGCRKAREGGAVKEAADRKGPRAPWAGAEAITSSLLRDSS